MVEGEKEKKMEVEEEEMEEGGTSISRGWLCIEVQPIERQTRATACQGSGVRGQETGIISRAPGVRCKMSGII